MVWKIEEVSTEGQNSEILVKNKRAGNGSLAVTSVNEVYS